MSTRKVAEVAQSRRKFLKSAAKLAVYTPPAMLVVSKPSFASFAQSGGVVREQSATVTHDESTAQSKRRGSRWTRVHSPTRWGQSWLNGVEDGQSD